MKYFLILLMVVGTSGCSKHITAISYTKANADKGIYYSLPKNILKLDIPFSLYRDFDLINGQKKYTSNPYAKIEQALAISTLTTSDENNKYILTYKDNKSNYFFEDSYTIELSSNGILKSLNWETENVTSDIIGNLVSTSLNVIKAITPADDEKELNKNLELIARYKNEIESIDVRIIEQTKNGNLKKIKELKEILDINISRYNLLKTHNKKSQKEKTIITKTLYIDIDKKYDNHPFITKVSTDLVSDQYNVDLRTTFKDVDEEFFPTISLILPKYKRSINNTEGIKYRIPKTVEYELKLNDSSDTKHPNRTIAKSTISIIQYGALNSLKLNSKGSKKSKIAITIDEKSGLITKVSSTNNSIIKESSAFLKSGSEEIKETFDNYAFKKQKTELENQKALLELQKSIQTLNAKEELPKDIEIQIAELKLLLEKLQLESEINELNGSKD